MFVCEIVRCIKIVDCKIAYCAYVSVRKSFLCLECISCNKCDLVFWKLNQLNQFVNMCQHYVIIENINTITYNCVIQVRVQPWCTEMCNCIYVNIYGKLYTCLNSVVVLLYSLQIIFGRIFWTWITTRCNKKSLALVVLLVSRLVYNLKNQILHQELQS